MVALALTLLFATAAPSAADPLGPAAEGKVQCYKPNAEKKTCASTAAYVRLPDGTIENRAVVVVSGTPLIIMETAAPVVVKSGGAVCAPFKESDVETGKFTVDGAPASDETVAKIKDFLKKAMGSLLNHEICTTYVPNGEQLRAEASVDGKRSPALDQPVIWVSPQDGYHVGV